MTFIRHFIFLTWREKGQLKILLIKTGLDIINEMLPSPENNPYSFRSELHEAIKIILPNQITQHTTCSPIKRYPNVL